MDFLERNYKIDKYGNFASEEEVKRAAEKNHIIETSTGYYDKVTGIEYWKDGTKK